ncbi:MAG: hypothetical protein ABIJ57_00530 [Pseudomonadota bacterium]
MNCPNRRIKRRVGAGGGKPRCGGTLRVQVECSVVFQAKTLPRGNGHEVESVLRSRHRKSGVRISPEELERAIQQGRYDVFCDVCGWSLRAAARSLNRKRNY